MRSKEKNFCSDKLVLGTALWGWKVSHADAMDILDRYAELGGRLIDTAQNYPINKKANDMGLAAKWIAEWLKSNPSAEVGLWYKMGAIDNLGGADANLSYQYLNDSLNSAQDLMKRAVEIVGIHWDNRSRQRQGDIDETFGFLRESREAGYKLALSGIKYPELYQSLFSTQEQGAELCIQVKDNAVTSEARRNYLKHFPSAKYYAYGINMGGVKSLAPPAPGSSLSLRNIEPQVAAESVVRLLDVRDMLSPSPANFNDIALMRVHLVSLLYGVLLGPSSRAQLEDSISFWKKLSSANQALEEHNKNIFGQYLDLD